MYYIGWLIPEQERNDLLRIFSPTFPDVYAHHITLQYDVEPDYPLPTIKRATLIGMCEAEAIEALVFEINKSMFRPDGSIFHCTWSLDKKIRMPVDSNVFLQNEGFKRFLVKRIINITPALMEA